MALHLASTHGQASVGCHGCHGGDPAETDKAKAHMVNFVAKPDAMGTLQMCGQCHIQPNRQFKASRHMPAQLNSPRLDCAECHGVHTIGSPPTSFSFSMFCAGCHGLEYLPALPPAFQQMLDLTDELSAEFRRLAELERTPAAGVTKLRKEIRRLTAEIVHSTDLEGGLQQVPRILKLGEELKRQIRLEQNQEHQR